AFSQISYARSWIRCSCHQPVMFSSTIQSLMGPSRFVSAIPPFSSPLSRGYLAIGHPLAQQARSLLILYRCPLWGPGHLPETSRRRSLICGRDDPDLATAYAGTGKPLSPRQSPSPCTTAEVQAP